MLRRPLLPFLPLLATALFVVSTTGCKEAFECSDVTQGDWAITFTDELGEDGGCPYEGAAILDDGVEYELSCSAEEGVCNCAAGDQFGIYDVTSTNTETGVTEHSVIEVDAAPSPHCITRDRLDQGSPVGGAGGGGN